MAMRVCIDAGHGGKDPGALKFKRYEKDDTLCIALKLGKLLEANGVDVVYTRTNDSYSSPAAKADIGNRVNADFFFCIHRKTSISKKASGIETLVHDKKGTKYKTAVAINKNLESLGFVNRGVKTRLNLAVLNRTEMPAILVEFGFITNDTDNKLLDKRFDEVIQLTAKAFLESQGINYTE